MARAYPKRLREQAKRENAREAMDRYVQRQKGSTLPLAADRKAIAEWWRARGY